MKLAIMQPYFFPYIGYWQLISVVDSFVVYDDVTYIKQGWINRNYILVNNKKHLITLDVFGASSNRLICDVKVGKRKNKILKTIEQNYHKAPYFDTAYQLIKNAFDIDEIFISKFLFFSIKILIEYLDLNTKIFFSSEIEKDNSLSGENKVIEICKKLNATHYYNPIGGKFLYSHKHFNLNKIQLSFIEPMPVNYRQFSEIFIPNLSIIDLLMFNSKNEISDMLNKYKLS